MSMKKIAYVFPGQGTYYIGMGKSFYEEYKPFRDTFDQASRILGIDLSELCFNGPDEELLKTENQQPAIHAMEVGIFEVLKANGILPDAVAGFSLGEYAALTAAGTFRFEDSIRLCRDRGLLMEKAVPNMQGKMVALLGMSVEQVRQIVDEVSKESLVEISIINCPGRVTVSGWNAGVDRVAAIAEELGYKASFMRVSGPFHTSLLDEAAAELKKRIQALDYKPPVCEYYPNAYGRIYHETDDIPTTMELHTSHAVQWQADIEQMVLAGVDTIVELGPKHGLISLNKRILEPMGAEVALYAGSTAEELDAFIKEYRAQKE